MNQYSVEICLGSERINITSNANVTVTDYECLGDSKTIFKYASKWFTGIN